MHNLFIFQQYVCYITLLNMFRAARCSKHTEERSVTYILLKNKRIPLSTCILYDCSQRVTIPEAVVIQLVLLRLSSVLLETC